MCPRLKIVIENDYKGSEIVDRSLECGNYDDCLLAIEMLALSDASLAAKLKDFRKSQADKVLADDAALQESLQQ